MAIEEAREGALPLRALAPAKLNLCLHVGPRRADGMHELCSLFVSVTLADVLILEQGDGAADEVVCPRVHGPNLAAAALARFRERFGWDAPPLLLTIDKRIPVAAGLGGGSADAAATLRLARAASGIDPPADELAELALSLGADVPSQLEPGVHLVTGIGERVEPLELGFPLPLVVLAGAGALATDKVYARADGRGLPPQDPAALAPELRAAVEAATGPADLAPIVHNDLQPAALALEPAALDALALLDEAGALAGAVSGSGPAVFGLFGSGTDAEAARRWIADGRWQADTVLAAAVPPGYGDPEPLD